MVSAYVHITPLFHESFHSKLLQVLGTIGTVLWSGQILPQIWKSWREKSTEGLSASLMFIWATSAVFLGVYNIVQDINIPLIVQPQLFGALAALSWVQCLYYSDKLTKRTCIAIYLTYIAIFVAIEAGASIALRAHQVYAASHSATKFFGISSAVLVSVGLIPQYIEIYRLKEVIGISLLFMAVDMGGGVFSVLSLIFRESFDVTASITYIAVVVLDGVVVVCALILNPRAKRRRASDMESLPEKSVDGGEAIQPPRASVDVKHASLKSNAKSPISASPNQPTSSIEEVIP
ncbi:hypothetical protein DL93DRAFT_2057223 [Clavulina sp. PMI_390]|nr:hypothetical protein DL93DRAFT_2057223 [Clavulina sp. PMI_390]